MGKNREKQTSLGEGWRRTSEMGKKAPKKVIKGSRYKHSKHGAETRYEEKNAEHPRVDCTGQRLRNGSFDECCLATPGPASHINIQSDRCLAVVPLYQVSSDLPVFTSLPPSHVLKIPFG